jgi:hypothetical protein
LLRSFLFPFYLLASSLSHSSPPLASRHAAHRTLLVPVLSSCNIFVRQEINYRQFHLKKKKKRRKEEE